MAYFGVQDHYEITTAPAHFMLDEEYKHQHWHYKNAGQQFDAWIREVRAYKKEKLSLNYLQTMATAFVDEHGVLPDNQLYNLKRWLVGRQLCYGHHLIAGSADDSHLHPINVACRLIRVLKPRESESIIAECTPVNICDLVEEFGSARARGVYNEIQPLNQWQYFMEKNYRCGVSTSSSSSSASSYSEGRGRRSSISSATSITSLASWRSRSTSPLRSLSSSPLNPLADGFRSKYTSATNDQSKPSSLNPLVGEFRMSYASVAATQPKAA